MIKISELGYNKTSIIVKFLNSIRKIVSCDITLKHWGLNYAHPVGVVINRKAIIHKSVRIYSHVVIGSKRVGDYTNMPIIEENCIIYTGAVIVGNTRIGNNSIIGAGAFVNHDIPPYSKVIPGNPVYVTPLRRK